MTAEQGSRGADCVDARCECSHRASDHGGSSRCIEPSKHCRCVHFRQCFHTEIRPWRDTKICAVCGAVVDEISHA